MTNQPGYTIKGGVIVTWHTAEFSIPEYREGILFRVLIVTDHGVVAVPIPRRRI
jgi:hypothetical protein